MLTSNWISLKDQLPPNSVGVLVTGVYGLKKFVTAARADIEHTGDGTPYVFWWDGHCFGGYEWEFDFDVADVTHWMPLPEPPAC